MKRRFALGLFARKLLAGITPADLVGLVTTYEADRIEGELILADALDDGSIDAAWNHAGGWTEVGGDLSTAVSPDRIQRKCATGSAVFQSTVNAEDAACESGMQFKGIAGTTFLMVVLDITNDTVELWKEITTTDTLLTSVSLTLATATDYVIKVVTLNDLVRVYVDDVHQFDYTLSGADFTTFDSGDFVGFRNLGGTTHFKDLTVTTLASATDLVLAEDTFTRGDGALGDEEGINGLTYVVNSVGGFEIETGKVRLSDTPTDFNAAGVDVGTRDIDIEGTIDGSELYLAFGIVDQHNLVYAGLNSSGAVVAYKRIGAVDTSILNAIAPNDSDVFRVVYDATNYWGYVFQGGEYAGRFVVGATDDASLGTRAGFFSVNTTTSTIDNITIRPAARIPAWPDSSGSGDLDAHWTQSDPAMQAIMLPDQTSNGSAAPFFDGVDDHYDATFSRTQPNTMVAAVGARRDVTSGYHVVYDGGGAGRQFVGSTAGTDWIMWASTTHSVAPAAGIATHMKVGSLFDGASSIIRYQGLETVGDAGTQGGTGAVVLGGEGTVRFWDGYIAEVVFADGDHSAEFAGLERYLSGRWDAAPIIDSFNRANNASLGSPTGTDQDWAHTAFVELDTNEAVGTSTSVNGHVTVDAKTNNMDVSGHFSGNGTNNNLSGPAFVDAAGNGSVYIAARYYPGNSNVLLVVYDPSPVIVATSATVATGETAFTLRMRRTGNKFEVWFDADETAALPLTGTPDITYTITGGDINLLQKATKVGANLWGSVANPASVTDIRVQY